MGSFLADPGSSTVVRAREAGKREAFSGSRSSDFPFPIAKALCQHVCESKKTSLQSDLTQASLDDPAVVAILSKRTDKKAFADDDRSPDLNPCVNPVRRRPRRIRS